MNQAQEEDKDAQEDSDDGQNSGDPIIQQTKKPYIILSRSNTRFYWDLVIIIFAIISSFTIPLQFAFKDKP